MRKPHHLWLRRRGCADRLVVVRAALLTAVLTVAAILADPVVARVRQIPQSRPPSMPFSDLTDASSRDIERMIQALGNPAFDIRSAATRALCRFPLAARSQLERAANGDDAERSLRARSVLKLIGQIDFVGVDIAIKFTAATIDWNDPVDLMVTLHNRSDYPATVPFELNKAALDTTTPDARQVGGMLDLADFLTLKDPNGKSVELRIDDYTENDSVERALSARLAGGPRATLAPRETTTMRIEAFNRGWARYPLLERGLYALTLDYLPRWQEAAFSQSAIGRATSNTASIQIHRAAPIEVSRSGIPASIEIERRKDILTVVLTNRDDLPWLIHTHFDPSGPPSATGAWVVTVGEQTAEIPAVTRVAASETPWAAKRLTRIEPGATLDLFSIEWHRLVAVAKSATDDPATDVETDWTVRAIYANVVDRRWLRRQKKRTGGTPRHPDLPESLPRRILTTHLVTPEVDAQGHPADKADGRPDSTDRPKRSTGKPMPIG